MKPLEELSLSELGRLFPISLVDSDPAWPEIYRKESESIVEVLGTLNVFRITHIGSTSVPGLIAKPTIDILLEIPHETNPDTVRVKLIAAGYLYNEQPDNPPPHMMFMKGYTPEGYKGQAFHVHVRYPGDWDEPIFADYLRKHKDVRDEYAETKRRCCDKYKDDREAYTQMKTECIRRITEVARKSER